MNDLNKKKVIILGLVLLILIQSLVGCKTNEYFKYSDTFYDSFDTIIQIVGYTKTEEEFQTYVDLMHNRFLHLHKLYDKYNTYEGINNIKTINDNAGVNPVKVDQEIVDLILFSKEWHEKTNGQTNIAMGAVLNIWHDYREAGIDDPENAKIPPLSSLQEAEKHTDINKVIVDVENKTVFLEDEKMSLDVGAVAKGFATEIVTKEAMAAGFESGLISAGGNVRTIGKPLDRVRERWGVGIQDPDKFIATETENLLDTIFVNNASIVSSGDYQRYYVVDGEVYHHLIDPNTLMPGKHFRAVSVVTEDSGVADFMSTTIFLMPYEEGKSLLESIGGIEAVWVMPDGSVEATEGMKKIMKSQGATGAKSE